MIRIHPNIECLLQPGNPNEIIGTIGNPGNKVDKVDGEFVSTE
jgi:hypothetical protein